MASQHQFRHYPSKRIDIWNLHDGRYLGNNGKRDRRSFRPFIKAARRAEAREAMQEQLAHALELEQWPLTCCDGECYECSSDG